MDCWMLIWRPKVAGAGQRASLAGMGFFFFVLTIVGLVFLAVKLAKIFIILGGIFTSVGAIGLVSFMYIFSKVSGEALISKRLGLFQAPTLTFGHRCTGLASIVGCFFVVGHVVTIVVTCIDSGFGWGVTAWILDLLGFFAALIFVPICRISSNEPSHGTKIHQYILWWSGMAFGSRIFDTLMLFGIVKTSSIYHTPSGVVLATNLVTEVFLGNLYTILALLGSCNLVCYPKDKEAYMPIQGTG